MVTAAESQSRFLFGAPSEQRFVNQSVNDQGERLLNQAYSEIDASFGPRNLRRFWGTKSFSYFAQEAILQSLATDTDKYFGNENRDTTALIPFLQILDSVQQKGAVLSQAVLVTAQQLSQRVETYDRKYDLEDRLTSTTDGRSVRYLFPKDAQGRLHLVKVVSAEALTLAQRSELESAI